MDPQKLFFLDKQVVKSDRTVSLLFSLAVAVLLIMVERGVITTAAFSMPVFWIGLITFTLLGVIQLTWNPYTHTKVLIYDLAYALSGALISIFIIGFNTALVFLAWQMLIITAAIYFSKKITTLFYGIFFSSLIAWLAMNHESLSTGETVEIISAGIFVGWITIFISAVWQLFNRNVKQLDSSRHNEKLVRERLASLINSMVDGVLAVDEKCKIIEYNGALLNILDLNITLRGKSIKNIGKLIDHNNQPVDIKSFVTRTKTQQVNTDYRIVYGDKSTANLYLSVASVHLGFGHEYTKGFVLVIRDITREKSLEEERSEFISVVSHELRTPIAIAEGNLGNAQFIVDKAKGNAKVKDAIKQAHEQILFLSGMINDLATLSRAERGKLTVEIEPINAKQLLEELSEEYKTEALTKGLQLKSHSDPELELLKSSKLYVHEILQNFITNSIKYTEKGSVTISARPYQDGVIFSVTDTGIGISKSDKEKVFDKFFRSGDFRTRANNGTGLGLYVTMKLTRLIHAEIDVQSELNKGSTFTITIPNLK